MSVSVGLRPDVSVVMATFNGEAHIGRALDSLGAQTLAASAFEIVLVINGPQDSTPSIVAAFRERHPDHTVRMCITEAPGVSQARNVGLEVARGQFVTHVDDDDHVSPTYLQSLLAAAAPGVIPHAFMVDIVEGESAPADPIKQSDNYVTAQIRQHAGKTVPAEVIASTLSANVGKLVPTAVARRTPYRTDLASGEDFVRWTEMFASTRFCVRVLDIESEAIYYRTVRPGTVSRQAPSFDFNVVQRLNCIAALSHLDNAAPVVRKVARDKVLAQVRHMNAYLMWKPEEREVVLEQIRARNLPWFPFEALNHGTARDLAFLYCFVPYQDTSALVAARRIRTRGVALDVICNELGKLREVDDWSQQICHEYLDQVLVTTAPQAMGNWRCIVAFVEAALQRAEAARTVKGDYRSVYSRAMWPASHFAAVAYKLAHPDVHWIAEFSDPMLHDIRGEVRPDLMEDDDLTQQLRKAIEAAGFTPPRELRMWEWVETVAYALADEIVFTNANQQQYMLSYVSDQALAERALAVSEVTHHPTLPAAFYHRVPSDYPLDKRKVNVAYFGAFYATRGVQEVLDALDDLEPDMRAVVKLHVFTNATDELAAQIERAGLAEAVSVNGYLPFLEFLNLTTRFDVLLVCDASTREHHSINPYLPSKLSDYLGSGTAIWSIVEPGSALSRVETRYQSVLGDVAGAKSVLCSVASAAEDAPLIPVPPTA